MIVRKTGKDITISKPDFQSGRFYSLLYLQIRDTIWKLSKKNFRSAKRRGKGFSKAGIYRPEAYLD